METSSDRRLLAYCLLAATVGIPASVWLFPRQEITILLIPVLVLAVAMFLDGYVSS